jgi:hypothetical protein
MPFRLWMRRPTPLIKVRLLLFYSAFVSDIEEKTPAAVATGNSEAQEDI